MEDPRSPAHELPPSPDATVIGDDPSQLVGAVIGPYKLVEQIGVGGFGLVFVAEQQKPVRRRVAIKIIKPGMDTHEVITRFEAERQALALMDHPNIARVLDAGATASGRPYFVMELVHGIPITDYCDKHQLALRERLVLFVSVCDAVQHAHQKGIIHRDIKPSNVLVTLHDGRPVVKVIDFGVAKALHQPLTDKTIYTRFMQMVGTPLYMSPEQAEMSGLDIDTRSDIYSLGVVLYELLTGTTPFDRKRLTQAGYDELIRIIREEEPPKPSTRLSYSTDVLPTIAAHRKTEPARLSRMLRGDLDWITMKALEKDRTRRYESASALARDIERYLADEPVEARPPSVGYRCRKLILRNKVALAAAALVAVALLLGTAVSTWQAVRANAERDRALAAEQKARVASENAQATLDFVWKEMLSQASPWEVADRDLKFRALIDRAADRLDAGSGSPPLVDAALRRMMGQLFTELGDPQKGLRFLEKALDVHRRELAEDDPEILTTGYLYGRCLSLLRRDDEAAAILGRNLELHRKVKGNDHPDTLEVMRWVGGTYSAQGRYQDGEPLLREAIERLSRLPANQARARISCQYSLALSLACRGDLDAAEAELKDCLTQAERMHETNDYPPVLHAKRTLAWVYVMQDKPINAEPLALDALKGTRHIMGNQHRLTSYAIHVLASVYQAQGRYDKATPLIAEAEAGTRLQEDNLRLALLLAMRGHNLVAEKKYEEAGSPLHECLAIWKKRQRQGGVFILAMSRRGVARECAYAKGVLGASVMGRKDFAGAEPLFLESYAGLKQQPGAGEDVTPFARRHQVEVLGWLVQLYDEWGKPDKATQWRKGLEAAMLTPKPAAGT